MNGRQQQSPRPSGSGQQYMILDINGNRLALPVADVAGLVSVKRSDICNVPFDSKHRVRGIFSYKGAVVAIAAVPGLTAAGDTGGADTLTAVLLGKGEKTFALIADSAVIVTGLPDGEAVYETGAGELYTKACGLSGGITHDTDK